MSLQLYRLSDLPRLWRCSRTVETLPGLNRFGPSTGTLWSFRNWIARTFQVLYLIQQGNDQEFNIIGYVGLYDIRLGSKLSLAIGIFDPKNRGIGLGRRALKLLLSSLTTCHAAQTIQVEISYTHTMSLAFFKQLGFEICEQNERTLLMTKAVKK